MMDAPMMPYDSRPATSAPLQRPMMAPQFIMSAPYSTAPMSSMTTPQYQSQVPVGFGSYNSSPTGLVSSFKQQYPERPALRLASTEPDLQRSLAYPREPRSAYLDGSRSPSVKSEPHMSSANSVASNPSAVSKTITSNISVGPNQVEFSTDVDTLMKAIQAKAETDDMVKKAESEVRQTQPSENLKTEAEQEQQPEGKTNRKKYMCDIPDCNKTFHQKTHLDIHRRAHTGEKPYFCKLPGCGQRFSQLGNLKTHERRHTGEKPYGCDRCGKRFAQRGNVRAHLKTHLQAKPFQCKLDSCNKRFTQLGNLKSHQNKFHAAALRALTTKFATVTDADKVTPADRELWEYFATLYKNSNKGIKGRGKDRKVGSVASASPISPNTSIPSHYPVNHPMSHPGGPHPSQHSHHGLHHPAAYGMSRPGPPQMMMSMPPRDPRGYDMYDVDHDSMAGSGAASTTSGTMYEDDHGRGELAFGDRMY